MIKYKFSKNMRILFVGINPHPGSFRRWVPFSNNKMFWYILNRAGIINEPILDLKKDETLRKIYNEKFNQVYDLGFVNIISRPTRKISLLKKNEEVKGRRFIISIIKKYSPIVVCFIGKSPYEKFIGSKDFDYGWQKNIYQSKVFVMHFPIRGKASIRISELKKLNKKG